MKRTWCLVVGIVMASLLCVAWASQRDGQWGKVQKAINEGLPRTAIEHLEPIIERAMAAEAYAEAIRAVGQKIALEGTIEGNRPEERIVRMDAEIEKAPDAMKPVMEAIQAHWHWHYFLQNRWRFMQRTATAESPSDDLTTWDLPRIFAEIDRRFTIALSHEDLLKTTPVVAYDDLLEKGTQPDSYRPTLYDFVAANALHFYSSGEQAAAKPQDAFVLQADSAVFGPPDAFRAWTVETPDQDAPLVKAIKLYQALLNFHQEAGNDDAFIDWDLDRLRFGFNHAAGEEKNARYKAALRRFIDRNGNHPVVGRAYHDLARTLHAEGDFVQAHEGAQQGLRQFKDTPGGRLCHNLIEAIEARSASVHTERVWNQAGPEIRVSYRNVDHIYFRLVAVDFDERLKVGRDQNVRHPEQFMPAEIEALSKKKPILSWSAELPPTPDFQTREEVLQAPLDVPPGFYMLFASHNRNFSDRDNQLTRTPVWVSDLALIIRTERGEGYLGGFVLDAVTGEPLIGARVRAWVYGWREPFRELEVAQTDAHGHFRVNGASNRSHLLMAEHNGQRLATQSGHHIHRHNQRVTPDRTVFFTDRAIYRPGQTIRFKGIALRMDTRSDTYHALPGKNVTVRLLDVNNEEVERLTLRANDYGSFSGSFTAPRDRLTGRMTIRTDSPNGSVAVSVEEYKRPTFQVALEAPEIAPRLNGTVELSGQAAAYTGAATDGAEVRWRVVRDARFPGWRPWGRYWPGANPGQEIAHGVTQTGVDGTFTISFTARPDPAIPEDSNPVFSYTVHTDVTDSAGETRSASRAVSAGYTALTATLRAESWLVADQPFDIEIHTASLDGVGQGAEGTLRMHRLQVPETVQRAELDNHRPYHSGRGMAVISSPDRSNADNWPLAESIDTAFTTGADGKAVLTVTLKAGAYRAVLETRDRFGKSVRTEYPLTILDPDAARLAIPEPFRLDAPTWTVQPGETFGALWGSGYEQAQAFVEVEHRGRIIQRYWTSADRTQAQIVQKIDESMRGDLFLRITMVRENRAYMESKRITVPWDNKKLDISWERFVSKLEPGQRETWTAIIRGPDAEAVTAEMVATLYDRSLDAFTSHNWPAHLAGFRQEHSYINSVFENGMQHFQHWKGNWRRDRQSVVMTYRTFPSEIIAHLWGYQFAERTRGGRHESRMMSFGEVAAPAAAMMDSSGMDGDGLYMLAEAEAPAGGVPKEAIAQDRPPAIDLDSVQARENLEETAFFFPHLVSEEDGTVRMTFTMPEALTEWRFMGFAHDRDLRSGLLTGSAVTSKELMVQPNPPRFLREGDELAFTVRISNQSPTRQTGTVRLTFTDAQSGDSVDAALDNEQTEQAFDIPAKESRAYAWRIRVPDGMGYLVYRAVAASDRYSDGEEAYVPVLSRRVFVTESLPLPIRGPDTRTFRFEKLLASGASDTLESKALTVQMVSNPTWYAVMALPYLMEFPHQCSEQIFNRLYANALARHIANADPRIRRVFDQWRNTPALDSPLEKNEDLKSVALEETPWVRQARSESQARRNVGILFDQNRLDDELARALFQLSQQQYGDGAWPWFPGGKPSEYITLYITTGFGRLRHLGVKDLDVSPAIKALTYLDRWMHERYQSIPVATRNQNHLSTQMALYLYGRSFFMQDQEVAAEHREAFDYFVRQARTYWLDLAHRQSQGHLAIALNRYGERETAQAIMRSIRERAVTDEEMGLFWRDQEYSWWWYRAPIETQALMIEAFDEVMNDQEAVEDASVWLIKQKQTQNWRTTKATADAVYALLRRGTDKLASDTLVEVSLAGQRIEPEKTEAGTGFYERTYTGTDIKPAMGEVTVRKVDEGVAWGSVHWQYVEDISKITPHTETPLTLEKRLYIRKNTPAGPQLVAVDGPVSVGDELIVRLVLRTDRDMEFVHLKDHRASGVEPVNVLSRYRFQDGLAYYESTRDTASHFFIDYLPKGTYVFEYATRIQHRGRYQTGMANIQCMYAPEFNSHSESLPLVVE